MKRKVIIVGAGGFARAIASMAALTPGIEVVGVADRIATTRGEQIGATSIVTTFDDLPRWRSEGIEGVALAIGDNSEREQMMRQAEAHGLVAVTLVHPAAHVDARVTIGAGTTVGPGAIVIAECKIGRGAIVNAGATIDHECEVGDFAQVSPGCCLAGRVVVGDRVMVGIGARVLPHLKVGADVVVGAGAVVTKDVPAGVTVVGIPARILGR